MFFDPNYIIFVLLPTLVISGLAQAWVRGAYQKWSNVPNSRGVTGQQTAQILMRDGGIQRVGLEMGKGELSDHYDPRAGVVRLSPGVASQPSVASMAIAAHEFGHVQQDQQKSPLMALRAMLIPSATLGPQLGIGLIIAGLILNVTGLAAVGLILFAGATVFTVVTLPVELDASRRAMNLLRETGLLADEQDAAGAKAVLRAAAFTYVAAVATSLLTLLYYAMLVFGRNRD
ncbi:MAG: zinc metallopeptidase [Anaerolineae bacterium]|nr:zinc metallopeptidase [Anaerolineae bacterium]